MLTRPGSREEGGRREAGDSGMTTNARNQTTRLCGPLGLRGGHRPEFPVVQERGWLRAGLPAESKAGKLSGSPQEDGAAGAEAALTETGEGPRVESRWGHSGSGTGACAGDAGP